MDRLTAWKLLDEADCHLTVARYVLMRADEGWQFIAYPQILLNPLHVCFGSWSWATRKRNHRKVANGLNPILGWKGWNPAFEEIVSEIQRWRVALITTVLRWIFMVWRGAWHTRWLLRYSRGYRRSRWKLARVALFGQVVKLSWWHSILARKVDV